MFGIIKFGFAAEIAGMNTGPPPEIPIACQGEAGAVELDTALGPDISWRG